MTWPQVWDEKREIVNVYEVKSYPTYLLIDHRGIITYRSSGWGQSKDTEVRNEVTKAIRAARRAAKEAEAGR